MRSRFVLAIPSVLLILFSYAASAIQAQGAPSSASTQQSEETMLDVLSIFVTLLFFMLAGIYVTGCDRLKGARS